MRDDSEIRREKTERSVGKALYLQRYILQLPTTKNLPHVIDTGSLQAQSLTPTETCHKQRKNSTVFLARGVHVNYHHDNTKVSIVSGHMM